MTGTDRLVSRLSSALGRGAAYVDLADALRGLVLDGQLVVGDRLPAERTLAASLGLSRTTITAALALLRAEGYLLSRQGSGTTVCLPADRVERPDEATPSIPLGNAEIDLTVATLPAPAQVLGATERAATRLVGWLSGRGLHPLGLPQLRSALARHMTSAGLPTNPNQLLITQGALHGWDLVLRAYLRPGNRVLVEQPTYPAALDAVRSHQGRFELLAVDSDGWHRPRRNGPQPDVAYLIPDFHNPTGHLADRAARRDVLRYARGALVCVDETFIELGYDTRPTSTAALSRDVVVAGSLSKLVWAGLRIGWLRAPPEIITRIAASRSSQDIASPVLDQLVALELVSELDQIAAARRTLLRARRDHAVTRVRQAGWKVDPPAGGMSLWVDLGGISSTHLFHAARHDDVRITPGPRFTATGTHDRFVRLPYTLPEGTFAHAIDVLTVAATRNSGPTVITTPQWTV